MADDLLKTVVTPPQLFMNWPSNVPGVSVQLSRWMSLRHRIANCRRHLNGWMVFGSVFLGSFLGLGPAAYADLFVKGQHLTPNTVLCGVSGLLAAVLWLAYRETSHGEADSIWSVVYEMDTMARECGHDPALLPSPFARQSILAKLWAYSNRHQGAHRRV